MKHWCYLNEVDTQKIFLTLQLQNDTETVKFYFEEVVTYVIYRAIKKVFLIPAHKNLDNWGLKKKEKKKKQLKRLKLRGIITDRKLQQSWKTLYPNVRPGFGLFSNWWSIHKDLDFMSYKSMKKKLLLRKSRNKLRMINSGCQRLFGEVFIASPLLVSAADTGASCRKKEKNLWYP